MRPHWSCTALVLICLAASRADAQPQAPERVLKGHTKDVTCLAFSGDGRTLATGGADGVVRLWHVPTGKLLHTLDGHAGPGITVALSPDGTVLASARDGFIRLWDATAGKQLRQLEGHTDLVNALAFTQGGTVLVSGSRDRTIRFWETATGRAVRTLRLEKDRVTALAVSADGKRLLSGGKTTETLQLGNNLVAIDRTAPARLWDVDTDRELRQFEARGSTVALSADGRVGVVAGVGSDVRVQGNTVKSTAYSQVAVLDPGQKVARRVFKGRGTAAALSADGRWLATAAGPGPRGGNSEDARTVLWDTAGGKEVAVLPVNDVKTLAFSPSGSTLAVAVGNDVQLWSVPALTGARK